MKKAYYIFAYAKDNYYVYYSIDDLKKNNGKSIEGFTKPFSLKRKICKGGVGSITEVEEEIVKDGKRFTYKKGAGPIQVWSCDKDRLNWNVLDAAAKTMKTTLRDSNVSLLQKQLEPITRLYQNNCFKRAAILAECIKIITNGRGTL